MNPRPDASKALDHFILAWLSWTRATAKSLAEATTFEEATQRLDELAVCHLILKDLTAAAAEKHTVDSAEPEQQRRAA